MNEMPDGLLAPDEPSPVTVRNEDGRVAVPDRRRSRGQFHPARARPARPPGERTGAAHRLGHRHRRGVAASWRMRSMPRWCSRTIRGSSSIATARPVSETSMPEISERTPVPGNVGLSEGRKAARVREIFQPYHDRIEAELDRRRQAGRPAVLIAMHSFTPVYPGRGAALACRRAVQPRYAIRPSPDGAFEARHGARRRRQRALQRDRCVGLHHPGARRTARPASRCD